MRKRSRRRFCAAGAVRLTSATAGWAEANIRAQFTSLLSAGFKVGLYKQPVANTFVHLVYVQVVLSAPAENKSGTGSTDQSPAPRTTPCEFNSCPAGSAAEGNNASDSTLPYTRL